jgi:TcdA/TcdB pore forming domain
MKSAAWLTLGSIICFSLPGHVIANLQSNQQSYDIYNDMRVWMQESLQNAVPLFCTLNNAQSPSEVSMRFYFPTQNMVNNIKVPGRFQNLVRRLLELQRSCQLDKPILLTLNRTLVSVARGSPESNLVAVLQGLQQNAQSQSNVDVSIMAASRAVASMQSAPTLGTARSFVDDLLLATSISSVVVSGHPIIATSGTLAQIGSLTTKLSLVLSFACVAGDSYSLYRSIQQGNRAGIASASVSLAGSAAGSGMGVTAIVLASKGAVVAPAVLGVFAVPLAGLTIGLSALVGTASSINQEVEACYKFFGNVIQSYDDPILTVSSQGVRILVGNNLTVFKHIDMRDNRVWFGDVLVRKNSASGIGITQRDGLLDVVTGFGFEKHSSFVFDESTPMMILPLTGNMELSYSTGQTFSNWNNGKSWQINRLNELYERMDREFSFYSGYVAIRKINVSDPNR